jgi:hypothetical protein
MNHITEAEARQQIAERVARAQHPRVRVAPTRHRVARHLRRFADRIDA